MICSLFWKTPAGLPSHPCSCQTNFKRNQFFSNTINGFITILDNETSSLVSILQVGTVVFILIVVQGRSQTFTLTRAKTCVKHILHFVLPSRGSVGMLHRTFWGFRCFQMQFTSTHLGYSSYIAIYIAISCSCQANTILSTG